VAGVWKERASCGAAPEHISRIVMLEGILMKLKLEFVNDVVVS
jgi:hypothetical protein